MSGGEGGEGTSGDAGAGAVTSGGSAMGVAGAQDGGASGASGAASGSAGDSGSSSGGADGGGGDGATAGEAGAGGSAGSLDTSGPSEGVVTVSGPINLTNDALGEGRTCAEAPAFSVTALTARSATLVAAPPPECLALGDEVLLINLQGTGGAYVNTGNWELLKVASLTGSEVGFTSNKTRHYGSAEASDNDLGIATTNQRVALVRVPHFTTLTIEAKATVSAAAWSGELGGVVALRADTLHVEGSVSAASLGYRGGHWSRDDQNCTENVLTQAGESISGLGQATTSRNVGASGGIAAAAIFYNANSPISPSAGHALPGEPGINANGRTLGEPGAVYGAADASKLTLGSGPGGNLTCDNVNAHEPYLADVGPRAGGIVLLLTDTLVVGASGSITATPPDPGRDVAPSGGYVYIKGNSLSVGDKRVTAQGAYGRSVNGPAVGQFNRAGAGYVVLEGAVTGTTDPQANVIP